MFYANAICCHVEFGIFVDYKQHRQNGSITILQQEFWTKMPKIKVKTRRKGSRSRLTFNLVEQRSLLVVKANTYLVNN